MIFKRANAAAGSVPSPAAVETAPAETHQRMVMAIDPGPQQSAFVVWSGARVIEKDILPNAEFISIVAGYAAEGSCQCAIEMIACYGMPVGRETFETCVWIGRFMERWMDYSKTEPVRIPRLDIKVHICRSAKAKDANIRQALIDRFGQPGTKKAQGALYGITSHCWAALAVAVYAFDRIPGVEN